jgi:hypothetical protein
MNETRLAQTRQPLTMDEFNMLNVVSDLLCKGEVHTRIANYFHDKNWNERRVRKFLDKCMLSKEWDKRIWEAYQGYDKLPFGFDEAQHLGDSLKRTAFFKPRTKVPNPMDDE